MDDVTDVVVAVAGPRGPGVVRHHGGLWLADDVSQSGGTGLTDCTVARQGISDGRWIVGGLLPEGAVRAVVTDVVGAARDAAVGPGAWAIVLTDADDDRLPVVAYRDAADALVRPPLPAAWRREPVTDATDACPACGAGVWEQVTANDHSRGAHGTDDHDMQPTPFVVCVACGHEEATVSFFALLPDEPDAAPLDAATVARMEAAAAAHIRSDLRERLTRLSFTPRAVAGLTMAASSWGGSGEDGRTTDLTLLHGRPDAGPWLELRDEEHGPWDDQPVSAVREALSRSLEAQGDWPRRSEPAVALWLSARRRATARAAALAEQAVISLPVDGIPHDFALRRSGTRWAAVARVGGGRRRRWLTLVGEGIEPDGLELCSVADPQALLAPEPGAAPIVPAYAPPARPRPALDPQRVGDLAQDGTLARVASELAALARPGLALLAAPAAAERKGGTRVGGAPDLPVDVAWPHFDGEQGSTPFTFLAQLALDDLPAEIWPGPRAGLLCIFAAIEPEYLGIERSEGALLIHVQPGQSLRAADLPADLPPELVSEGHAATVASLLTLPGAAVSASRPLRDLGLADDYDMLGEGDQEALDELHEQLAPDGHILARILGWPDLMQHDPLEELVRRAAGEDAPAAEAGSWSLLLQTDRDGTLVTVALPTAALVAGELRTAEAIVDFD